MDAPTELAASPSSGWGAALAELAADLPGPSLSEAFEEVPPAAATEPTAAADEYADLDFGRCLPDDIADGVRAALRAHARATLAAPPAVMLRHKLTFAASSCALVVSAYWLGAAPETFPLWYMGLMLPLLVVRFVTYRAARAHYYGFDLCYFVQLLLALQFCALPASEALAKINFSLSFGPLLWSVVAFRNSLVYHSVDKTTSLALHLLPALACWAARWHPPPAARAALAADAGAAARREAGGARDLVLLPLLPYGLWAVLYYAKLFVVSPNRIAERGYETLFVYVTSRRRSLYGRIVLAAPRRLQPLVYMLVHLACTTAVLCAASALWARREAAAAAAAAAYALAAWHGGSFYVDWFAHKYLEKLGVPRRGAQQRGKGD